MKLQYGCKNKNRNGVVIKTMERGVVNILNLRFLVKT